MFDQFTWPILNLFVWFLLYFVLLCYLMLCYVMFVVFFSFYPLPCLSIYIFNSLCLSLSSLSLFLSSPLAYLFFFLFFLSFCVSLFSFYRLSTKKERRSELRELMARDPTEATAHSFLAVFAFVFYPPLYIAGPILTFNAFVNQVDVSSSPSLFPYAFLFVYFAS